MDDYEKEKAQNDFDNSLMVFEGHLPSCNELFQKYFGGDIHIEWEIDRELLEIRVTSFDKGSKYEYAIRQEKYNKEKKGYGWRAYRLVPYAHLFKVYDWHKYECPIAAFQDVMKNIFLNKISGDMQSLEIQRDMGSLCK